MSESVIDFRLFKLIEICFCGRFATMPQGFTYDGCGNSGSY